MNAITVMRRQWDEICDQPGWPMRGWPTLADARSRDDDTMLALLQLHREGDPRAGMVLAMICLNALVGRAHRLGLDPDDCLAALWVALSRYPLESRPWRVHGNLVLDACRDAARMRWSREVLLDPSVLDEWITPDEPDPDDDPSAGAVIQAGVHLGLVTCDEGSLLRAVSVDGVPAARLAHAHGVSPRAVQRRHARATRRLTALREILCPAA